MAEAFFSELDVDGFFLEFDDRRSGGFEPRRFVPGQEGWPRARHDQARRPRIEGPLKKRIEEASRYVALDQLCLSPQCGFSSTVEGNSLTFNDEVAKLRLVVETAHEIWG